MRLLVNLQLRQCNVRFTLLYDVNLMIHLVHSILASRVYLENDKKKIQL